MFICTPQAVSGYIRVPKKLAYILQPGMATVILALLWAKQAIDFIDVLIKYGKELSEEPSAT